MPDDPVKAALQERRALLEAAALPVTSASRITVEFRLGLAVGAACAFEAALRAALEHHRPESLYGNAATPEEPGCCPHDPDSDLHFEAGDGSGEWLCEGKPEGVVCSCTESSDGERIPYPCEEVAAILAALTEEEKASG